MELDFYMLILYPKTLPDSLTSYNICVCVCVVFRVFKYNIKSSANRDSFTSPFTIWDALGFA